MDPKKIIEIFPTPVYIDTVPLGHEHLIKFFDSLEMMGIDSQEEKKIDSFNFGARSKNTFVLNSPECLNFSNYILKLSKKFGETLGYNYKNYKFTQSWISHKYPGQQHTKHTHANSLLSGIFYYGLFDENTPSIQFHKPTFTSNLILSPLLVPNPNYHFSFPTYTIKSGPGMILLFPSDLILSVPLNTTSNVRKSLAFNIVPEKGFGDENELTLLDF